MRREPFVAAVAMLLAGAAPAAAAERGFAVAGFDRVENASWVDVRIHTGAAASVRATGDQAVLDRLTVEVRDGVLRVGTQPESRWRWSWHAPTIVFVTVPMVRGLALTGSGNVSVDSVRTRAFDATLGGSGTIRIGAVQADRVALALGGSGDLIAAGRAGRATLALNGSGNLRAGGLTAADAAITLTGSGDVAATATRAAQVSLTGSGSATVTGGARCAIVRRGSGDVRCG